MDLDAIAHNYHVLRELVGAGVRVCPVVKADAYGHGAVAVAGRLAREGATDLAVADAAEAITLRMSGWTGAVHVLYHPLAPEAPLLVTSGATVALGAPDLIPPLAAAARALRRRCKVALVIDTGMGRGGCRPAAAPALAAAIAAQPELELTGAFTHFPVVRRVPDTTRLPFARFQATCDAIQASGIALPRRHAANSAACYLAPATHADMVRPGLALYGVAPEGEAGAGLRPALRVRARVMAVVDVAAGDTIGYRPGFTASRDTRVAVLPVGYADGYPYRLGNRGRVLVRGIVAPVVGPVSMDCTVIDVTRAAQVQPGDAVTLVGPAAAGDGAIGLRELADAAGTIPYELCTGLAGRLPRRHLGA